MLPATADERLSQARIMLERRGIADADLLAPPIRDSWTRCLAAGLDPERPPPLAMVDDATLREARDRSDLALRLARTEMKNLYHQVAGTNFMIAFAAPDALLLDTISDSSFSATARATAIRPGSLWAETRCGTNALGTTAQQGQPITVHGGEHFFNRYGTLTCTAVPVFGPDASLAGVLDASSDCRSRQQHTRALVAMAATQIENGLFRECHHASMVIAFHSRGEYLHTLNAGLLALDPDGAVLGANPQARFLLQGLAALPGSHFADLFHTRLGSFLDGARTRERQRLDDLVGSAFVATIETLPQPRRMPSPPRASRVLPTGFIADDRRVAEVVRRVEAAAARKLPILIRGETGTGKEQLARHAHLAGRRTGEFVPLNCAALPDSLAEAELFGHTDGAFTGARRGGAPGLVVEADGGTLFLDEIGDMPLPLQAVLLRLLDDWTVRPVGGGKRRTVDVQVVAATNADLERAVTAGTFRADLFYRLSAVEVTLPPLAERRDFGAIVRHLLSEIAPDRSITPTALDRLAERPWPGNVRELRNVLSRLSLDEADRPIDLDDVDSLPEPPAGLSRHQAPSCLRETVQQRIRAVHSDLSGNISETARRLGVSRNTIYRALRASMPD
ncbi:sigma-54-dependent Fis family transcriptional regulator [Inquilinus sp. OTU3971]|uniref:sigma-54-dependent Fis family transcriptional regulator n=1 Tax=Inquilinus sp. OTU3971 TaxID=3043855 RepID=UPI00313DAB31